MSNLMQKGVSSRVKFDLKKHIEQYHTIDEHMKGIFQVRFYDVSHSFTVDYDSPILDDIMIDGYFLYVDDTKFKLVTMLIDIVLKVQLIK